MPEERSPAGATEASAEAAAPAVAVIVVASSPSSDTEFALQALSAQEYPRLAVLVLCDAQGEQGRRVMRQLPDAEVADPVSSRASRDREAQRRHMGAIFNRGASLVQGADYLLFLTDRIALAPDAIGLLVGEAENASDGVIGVAGPKLRDADDGLTLRDLGGSVDRLAVRIPVVGRDELDQGQHDEARDRFVAPTEAMLVRRELFESTGGFDPELEGDGAAVDLCWRIQLRGARVRVVPAAIGAMRSDTAKAGHEPSARRHEHRARLRTMAKCYGWVYLLPAVVLGAVLAGGEVLFAALRGRFAQAADVCRAWAWNARHIAGTVALRSAAKRYRRVRDADLRRLQQGGSVRVADWLRYRLSPESGRAARTRIDESILGNWRRNAHRSVWAVWLGVVGLIAFGSRHLLTGGIAAYGQFAYFPDVATMVSSYLDGWRDGGVGAAGIGPAAMGLLGLGGTVLLGASGLLRSLAVWGLVLAALWGMWRLCASVRHRNGRLVALVLYAACPLPYNALAHGRWDVLLAYGTAPAIVLLVSGLVGTSPALPAGDLGRRGTAARVATLGLLLAAVAAFEPFVVVPALAGAVMLAMVELMRRASSGESLGAPIAGLGRVMVAAVLAGIAHLPWLLEFASWRTYVDVSLGGSVPWTPSSLAELLAFRTGPLGELPMSWGLLVVAAVPLLVGSGGRLRQAVRGWLVGLVGIATAWLVVTGWTDDLLGSAGLGPSLAAVSLVFGAVGLCWAAASAPGALAQTDGDVSPRLRGIMVLVSAVAVGAMVLPTAWAAIDGDWSAPRFDHRVPLRLVDDRDVGPDYRVLWIGAPEVLPLRGTDLGVEGLAAGTSVRGYPDIRHSWAIPAAPGDERLAEAIRAGLAGDTLRLGRLLGAFGIRFVVVVERSGPSYAEGWERPVSPAVSEALASQLDLLPLAADPSVQVFRNEAWWSSRSQFERPIPDDFALNPVDLVVLDMSDDGFGVLTDYRSATSQLGPVDAAVVLVAESYDPGWRLDVEEAVVEPTPALGWAMRFDPPRAGLAELSFERSAAVTSRIAAQVLIWLALAWVAIGQPTPFADRLSGRLGATRASARREVADCEAGQ
ncbi:glycosyltransferase family 2 protein [Candidatus Poriferisodalis sp.]|uniref:glycosyltransferase family 2 protein n=1 Tax=Candidatus Poriferisodalis sp. TaxID=3101277 RepID=UPI003B017936